MIVIAANFEFRFDKMAAGNKRSDAGVPSIVFRKWAWVRAGGGVTGNGTRGPVHSGDSRFCYGYYFQMATVEISTKNDMWIVNIR